MSIPRLIPQLAVVALVLISSSPRGRAAEAVTLEVAAGEHDRQDTIVVSELPEALRDTKVFRLARLDNGVALPVQWVPGVKPQVAWIVREKLPAGQSRRYRLVAAGNLLDKFGGGVTVDDDGRRLLVRSGGRPVLCYNHAVVPSPIPNTPCYARSGYIHPVYNPSGQVVTDDFNPGPRPSARDHDGLDQGDLRGPAVQLLGPEVGPGPCGARQDGRAGRGARVRPLHRAAAAR